MYCRMCGLENPDDSRFCERCGAAASRRATTASAAPSTYRRTTSHTGLRTLTPTGEAPSLPRSLTAEFRSFSLDSPYLAIPTPIHGVPIPGAEVTLDDPPPVAVPFPPEPEPELRFNPLRPSETVWMIDGVITHLFDDELTLVPDRRFLHVKLMDGDEERFYRRYGGAYWDDVVPLCVDPRPAKGRRLCIFHRPTDMVPGLPFMNFGIELALQEGADRDTPADPIQLAFRMKHYYSGRAEELQEAFRYAKPLQLVLSAMTDLGARVGLPVDARSRIWRALDHLASGRSGLIDKVTQRLERKRTTDDSGRVALATELYSAIVGVQFGAKTTRFMVADSLGFLPDLVESPPGDNDIEDGFTYKRVTGRMAVLIREHGDP